MQDNGFQHHTENACAIHTQITLPSVSKKNVLSTHFWIIFTCAIFPTTPSKFYPFSPPLQRLT